MGTVQEAASLFGSGPDEGSDPFVSAVTSSDSAQDSSPFSPPSTSSTNTTYDPKSGPVQGNVAASNAHGYKAVDDLFGGAPSDGVDDPFGAGGASGSDWLGTGDVNAADASGTQGGYSDYSNHTNTTSSGAFKQRQGLPGYGQAQQQQHHQAYGTSGFFRTPRGYDFIKQCL